MSLDKNSLLVNLNIAVWTGRKLDKEVSQEVDAAKSTRTRAGNYNKNLFAGVKELEEVKRVAGKAYVWHREQTLPWSDGGERLLSMGNFQTYKQELARLEQEFNDVKEVFCNQYATLISSQAFMLGALFKRDDYPRPSHIASKFDFRYTFSPVPQAGDWRVVTDDAIRNELDEHYRKAYEDRVVAANKDLWARLHECLKHMAERLTDTEEGKRRIIRDSVIENTIEMCNLLTRLNVTNDVYLETARKEVEAMLVGMTGEEIRKHDGARHELKTKVEAILNRFDF